MISNNKISNIVQSQLPFYVRNDHENFVAFMEAYYEFLEQQTGAINVSRSLLDQMDIDSTDLFAQKFYDNFIALLPDNILADKNTITKHIKDFYRARGSEKSIRFLMRILFNEDVDFYYPKVDVLRASDGKWFVENSIKITDVKINGNANNDIAVTNSFVGKKVTGQTSNATAIVEKADIYYETGSLVRELKISNIYKTFSFGEEISTTIVENGVNKTLTANLFSGGLNTIKIINPGSGYLVGDDIPVEGGNGSGAKVVVSSVSSGNLTSIATLFGGAGFRVNDAILISGGGGSGANGKVLSVRSDGSFHPNSYNIMSSIIGLETNTKLSNTRYANISPVAIANANTTIANSTAFFVYANTGPIVDVILVSKGTNYTSRPTISAEANNRIRNLGILGRMEIIDGGVGYMVNDTLNFINQFGSYGFGALGRVKSVNTASQNTITEVEFVQVPGQIIGGSGYDRFRLPSVNVVSANVNAYGANIAVTSILGYNETVVSVGSTEGSILTLSITARGSGYDSTPTINLKSKGDGTAQAEATIITGAYTYPGRYINDDGHLSSYNFLQNRDYYQPFSYVVKVKQSLEKYKKILKDLIHPGGMKLLGEYSFVDNGETLNVNIRGIADLISIGTLRTYSHETGNVTINYSDHGLTSGNSVYVEWRTGNVANANANSGLFEIKQVVNANNFVVNTNTILYLSNTLLPPATGTANVYKIVV